MKLFSSQIGVDAQNLENLIGKNRVQNVRTGFTLVLGGGTYLIVFSIKDYGCIGGIRVIQTIITLGISIFSIRIVDTVF